ncbi:IS1182 family transposase [Novipirellula sp.]|uniref:IS1182 family transposase n=1 Tax=Novipirellula sp. TaxID=2795430 RepID=UPI003568C9BC
MNNPSNATQRGQARTNRPERTQIEMRMLSLDQLVASDHRVRLVWAYCQSLDLSPFYQPIKARQGTRGRNPIDPRILFALWFYATLEGITSARRIAELTTRDFCYLWICGGVTVNYHTLSDFRTKHIEELEQLLSDSITVLLNEKLITLETIGQDGMRVRASAGSSSFRSEPTLQRMQEEAEKYLEELKEQSEQENQADVSVAQQAARERAAEERLERIKAAQENLEELERRRREKKSRKSKSTPRASTTDPEAVRMKMGDGGFRPAFNVQFATDGETRIVVGVDVNNQGSDMGQMLPVFESVCSTYGVVPGQYLVDGGFIKASDIDALDAAGTTVYGAVKGAEKDVADGKAPYQAKSTDSEAMGRFRERMGAEEAQAIYQQRPSIAEFPNAECRNRGLNQFRVRGQRKALGQTLWHVLVNNFNRFQHMGFLPKLMGEHSAQTTAN